MLKTAPFPFASKMAGVMAATSSTPSPTTTMFASLGKTMIQNYYHVDGARTGFGSPSGTRMSASVCQIPKAASSAARRGGGGSRNHNKDCGGRSGVAAVLQSSLCSSPGAADFAAKRKAEGTNG